MSEDDAEPGGVRGGLNALVTALLNGGLKAGWRAATSDGQGPFLAAMILFGIAAYSFHFGMQPQVERERRLEQAAGDKQESLEGERYPILASVVTPRNESILCRDQGRALRDALRTAYATFATRATVLYDATPRDLVKSGVAVPAAPAGAAAAPATPGATGTSATTATPSTTAASTTTASATTAAAPAAVERVHYALKPVCGTRTINIGPAWTEDADPPREHESTLFIPSTLALRANLVCPDACSAQSACTDKAIAALSSEFDHVLSTSQALESLDFSAIESGLAVAIPPVAEPQELSKPSESGKPADPTSVARPVPPRGQLVQSEPPRSASYFISPEGIARIMPAFDVDNILAHYMSNGSSYFSSALQRVSQGDACRPLRPAGSTASDKLEGFVTYPYLDMFGGGLVETYCAPIDVVHGKAAARAKTTIGVLCTDVAQPEAEVLHGLVGVSAALDLSVVRVWRPETEQHTDELPGTTPGNRWPRDLEVRPCSDIPNCAAKLNTFGDWSELRLFATLYHNNTLSNRHALRPGGVFVDGDDSDAKFAVAVYRGDRYWDVAIGRLRQPGRRDYAALALSGLAIFLAISILAIGYRQKMRRREAYLARGLAYGLLRVGALDNIIGGNDRAESVLNVGLPRLGVYNDGGKPRNTFSGFIDYLQCVLIPISGTLNQRCIVNYDQVRRRSIDGLTTDFYAYLKSGTWIRVSTRIVVLPSKQEELFYAIDSHICDEHAAFLGALHG